jgi:hypothetical protein
MDIQYQLVPPHIHRRNAAERAIRTFKNHFIAGLSSTNPHFPLHLWCRLVPQAEETLNMLCTSCLNPKLSAYNYLFGVHNFNAHPMAPPGIKVIAHEKPAKRASWATHGIDGWYIGPTYEHYRCYRIYATKTRAERICDTVEFFPHNFRMPEQSSADAAIRAAQELIHALNTRNRPHHFKNSAMNI